jgi:hypothetical protein
MVIQYSPKQLFRSEFTIFNNKLSPCFEYIVAIYKLLVRHIE